MDEFVEFLRISEQMPLSGVTQNIFSSLLRAHDRFARASAYAADAIVERNGSVTVFTDSQIT